MKKKQLEKQKMEQDRKMKNIEILTTLKKEGGKVGKKGRNWSKLKNSKKEKMNKIKN